MSALSRSLHFFRRSPHISARVARSIYWGLQRLSLPAPKAIVVPFLTIYLSARTAYHIFRRLFIAEPLFKAYCTTYGRRLRTGIYVHWIQGHGRIVLGDDVVIDGKCSLSFAQWLTETPTLKIGNNTGLGHACSITVARAVSIGSDCRIAEGVWIFDTGGHPIDPHARLQNNPPREQDVRPVILEDNVWIGAFSIVGPGVRIGQGSVIAAGSVVMSDIPPNTLVAGNPARKVMTLQAE